MKNRIPYQLLANLVDNINSLSDGNHIEFSLAQKAKIKAESESKFSKEFVEICIQFLIKQNVLTPIQSNKGWKIDQKNIQSRSAIEEAFKEQINFRNLIFRDVGELAFDNISIFQNSKWKLISEEYDIDAESVYYFKQSKDLMYQYWTDESDIHLASNFQKHIRAIKIKKGIIDRFKIEISEPGQEAGWISISTSNENLRGAILRGKIQEKSKSDFRNKIFKLETSIIPQLISEFNGRINETKKYW